MGCAKVISSWALYSAEALIELITFHKSKQMERSVREPRLLNIKKKKENILGRNERKNYLKTI